MAPDLVLALAVFALSNTFQPGPNNAVLMASGLNFGFVRTLPSILGLTLGFTVMMIAVGFGLAALFELFPALHTLLKLASVVYLLYLAWRVARSTPRSGAGGGQPLSFSEGFGIIVLNPQGWMFATSFVTAYLVRSQILVSVLILTVVCVLARLTGAVAWTVFGAMLRHVLQSPGAVRGFNLAMAALMVASLWPIVRQLPAEIETLVAGWR